jgi:hypothetical protein
MEGVLSPLRVEPDQVVSDSIAVRLQDEAVGDDESRWKVPRRRWPRRERGTPELLTGVVVHVGTFVTLERVLGVMA